MKVDIGLNEDPLDGVDLYPTWQASGGKHMFVCVVCLPSK